MLILNRSSRSTSALIFVLACLPNAAAQYDGAAPVDERMKPGFDSIEPEFCKEILGYLAGPECEGRGSGSEGYQKAADYVAARFKEFGLKPLGDPASYHQNVPFRRVRTVPEECVISAAELRLRPGQDFHVDGGEADAETEVVIVSGATDAILEDSKSLRQRLVVLDVEGGDRSGVRRQMNRDRPLAILTVVDKIDPAARSGGGRAGRTVSGMITREALGRLAKALGGGDDASSAPAAADGKATATLLPGGKAKLVVKTVREEIGVPNVVGFLEGSDPVLKDEIVICGSHLDHLGKRPDGTTFPGADDDGSGSTGLVAMVRAFAKNPVKPKRSLLFLAFCQEELGLVGSAYYVEHPLVPLDRAVCELQMDMIGRNEEKDDEGPEENLRTTHLVGSKRISRALHELVLDSNKHLGFEFEYDEESVYGRSDHYNFAKKGIPIAFFFSGFHPDYHRPTDTPDKINYEKLANTAKLVYLVAFRAADLPERLPREK